MATPYKTFIISKTQYLPNDYFPYVTYRNQQIQAVALETFIALSNWCSSYSFCTFVQTWGLKTCNNLQNQRCSLSNSHWFQNGFLDIHWLPCGKLADALLEHWGLSLSIEIWSRNFRVLSRVPWFYSVRSVSLSGPPPPTPTLLLKSCYENLSKSEGQNLFWWML